MLANMHCIVPNCNNDSDVSSEDVTYHKFPPQGPARAAWAAALRAGGWRGARGAVCSRHFPRAALATSVGGRRRLRADAVPLLPTPGKPTRCCPEEEMDGDPCDVKACRICFAVDCRLYLMRNYEKLYVAYEMLAGLLLEQETRLPSYLCGDCARRVLRCERMRGAVLRAHYTLLDLVRNHDCITLELLQSVRDKQSSSEVDDIDMDFDIDLADDTADEKPPGDMNDFDVDSIKTEGSDIVSVKIVGVNDSATNSPLAKLGSPEDTVEDEVEVKSEFELEIKQESDIDELTKAGHEFMFEIKQESDNDEFTKADPHNFAKREIKRGSENEMYRADSDLEDVGEDSSSDEKLPRKKRKVTLKKERDEVEAVILRGPKVAKGLLIDNKYCCDTCPYETKCESVLSKHLKIHAAPVSYSCNICRFLTVSKYHIKYHIKEHSDAKKFSCDFCSKKFRKCHTLKVHRRLHTGEKPFTCRICRAGYSRKDSLKVHMRTHTGERPHRCTVCDRSFSAQGHLTAHFRKHTGQKPYTCRTCNKLFAYKTSLTMHMKTHEGDQSDKPYACQVCHKRFFYPSSLARHSRVVHCDENPFSCATCNESFTQCSALRIHLKTHSDDTT